MNDNFSLEISVEDAKVILQCMDLTTKQCGLPTAKLILPTYTKVLEAAEPHITAAQGAVQTDAESPESKV